MAVNSKICTTLISSFLLAALSTARLSKMAKDPSSDKVSVRLYYETLCPFCSNFIAYHLNKLVDDDGLMGIVDLRLVPYGNAIIVNGTIQCQHGEDECFLNKMDACAIDAVPSVKEHFPFIQCVEKIFAEHQENSSTAWNECFQKLPAEVDMKSFCDCTIGDRGLELEFKYAKETEALQPPHEFVPWVTVNGVPLYDDFENLISFICDAYKGPNVPKACSSTSLENNTLTNSRKVELRVCGRKELPKPSATKIKLAIPWLIKN